MAAPSRPGRPSPAERRRRRTRTLALVVAIALVATLAVPLAALAVPAALPAAVDGSQDRRDAEEVLGTDAVHEVWLWTTAFLRGDGDAVAAPVETAEQWVAAKDGGTRTAWRDPGLDRVVLAGSDDDVELARALGDLAPGERLVTDEGDWLVLGEDGTVRALLPERSGGLAGAPVTLADFQTDRSARWEAVLADAQDGQAVGGGSGGPAADGDAADGVRAAVPWAVGAALLLTGTALVVRARRQDPAVVTGPDRANG